MSVYEQMDFYDLAEEPAERASQLAQLLGKVEGFVLRIIEAVESDKAKSGKRKRSVESESEGKRVRNV